MRQAGHWAHVLGGLVLLMAGAGVVHGADLAAEGLLLPAACRLGETCWVANYADTDPTRQARDFRCRFRSYDGHDGVDVAIRDLRTMAEGVAVLASTTGIVKSVRDGMEDVAITGETSRARIKGRECGNGVLLIHEGGWETQYCHLRKGSVSVAAGRRVEAGTPIGLIGLSGKTEFPHVHLTVRRNGVALDPFTGLPVSAGCGQAGASLWRPDQHVVYEPAAIVNAGFSTGKPDMEAIRTGRREPGPFPPSAPALVLWADIFGVEAGDGVRFAIVGPDGTGVFEYQQRVDKTQARRFVFAGSRLKGPAWEAGRYVGRVSLVRGDQQVTTAIEMRVE